MHFSVKISEICENFFLSQITQINTDFNSSVKIPAYRQAGVKSVRHIMHSTYFAIAHFYFANQFLLQASTSDLLYKMSNRFYTQYASFVLLYHLLEFDPVSIQQCFLPALHIS